jgi:hypothetical protein
VSGIRRRPSIGSRSTFRSVRSCESRNAVVRSALTSVAMPFTFSLSQRRYVPKLANPATSTELAIAVRRSFHQTGTGLVAGSEEVRQEPRFPRGVGILIATWVPGARLDGLRER